MPASANRHPPRVQALLAAAQQALRERPDFVVVAGGSVTLEVVLYAPPGSVPGDATNYLGGIADVLEQKTQGSALEHLGTLACVWLYRNDRQIKQVHYTEAVGDYTGYRVTVRSF